MGIYLGQVATNKKLKAKYHFIEENNNKLYNFYDIDNVVSLIIFKSGWNDKYHCILEWGEHETTESHLYTSKEIEKKYGISTFLRKEKLIKINESIL